MTDPRIAYGPHRAAIVFSCVGHLYIHLFTAFYFVIVLALEDAWQLPYPRLVELWTVGALLVGLGALPAGMLADRFGANGLMVAFFLGIGGCSMAAGFSDSPATLWLALAGIGLFAAIYHPVGIPWLVRNAGGSRGRLLGFNGIFGSLGTAVAGLAAGVLIDFAGWRAAFLVPGALSLATGVAPAWYVARGEIVDRIETGAAPGAPSSADRRRVFVILMVTMFIAGLIYHSTQASLPKVFEQRAALAGGASTIGLLVATVYGAAGLMQVVGGYLADRFPVRFVYLGAIVIQAPLLLVAASASGAPLVLVATLMVMANASALPAENMLLARYAPANRHGLVFGLKFVLAFGAGPLAVQLVARVIEQTGDFFWVFALLAVCALASMVAASLLPRERAAAAVVVAE